MVLFRLQFLNMLVLSLEPNFPIRYIINDVDNFILFISDFLFCFLSFCKVVEIHVHKNNIHIYGALIQNSVETFLIWRPNTFYCCYMNRKLFFTLNLNNSITIAYRYGYLKQVNELEANKTKRFKTICWLITQSLSDIIPSQMNIH